MFACFLSQEEPKRIRQALNDPSWIEAMQEEHLQFKMQKVWILVDLPYGKRAIGTKWVYRNKKDERGIVVRNKARLVAQAHTQEEGIDYEECTKWMSKVHFSMELLKKKYTFVNHQGLRIQNILTKYAKWSRHFMVYIKLLELGMKLWLPIF
nr:putative ribonuclease H-like domain-containing protein [Tanacetum cinerariifolium]